MFYKYIILKMKNTHIKLNNLYKIKKRITISHDMIVGDFHIELFFCLMNMNCVVWLKNSFNYKVSYLEKTYYYNNYYTLKLGNEAYEDFDYFNKCKNFKLVMFI